MNTSGNTRNRYYQIQALAGALLAAGILTIVSVLYFGEIKAGFPVHAVMFMEGLLTLLTAIALLAVMCFAKQWTRPEQGRIWLMLTLGIGLIFVYSAADVADNFLVVHHGDGLLELYKEVALLLGATVLVSGSFIWIRELLRTREQLLIREQKLSESEYKFRNLFELYPDATLLIDPETALPVQFNRMAYEQLGYTAREFAGMTIPDYEAKESPEETARHIEHILEHGRDDFETMHRCKDGSEIHVNVTVMLLEQEEKKYFLCVFRDITDRKAAMQALERSEQRFRDVAEAAGEYIWEIDPKGVYSFLTPRVEDVLGRGADEILGRSPFDYMPPEEAARVEKMLAEWAAKGESWQGLEHQSLRPDGKIVWQRVSGMTIKGADGELTGFRGTGLDITERVKAEKELAESEARLEAFFTQSFSGFFFMMLDEPVAWNQATEDEKADLLEYVMMHQRMTKVNQAMLDQYGAKEEDFIGLTPADLFAHDLEHGRHIWKGLFDQGRWHVETREQRLDGTPIIIDGDYICLYDEQGRVTGHFGVQSDITERRRIENENLVLANIFKRSQDFIGVADMEKDAFFVNPAGQAMVGLDGDDAVQGTTIKDYFPDEDLPFVEETILPALMTEGRWYGEFRFRHFKTNTPIPVLYDLFLTENPDTGQATNITTITRDITDLKQAEEKLHEYAQQMELKTVELDAALIKAEQASLAKGEFLANMSHEIRTPMNAVIGLSQLLLQTSLNDRQRDYLAKISNSSRMLLGIINDILDYSKIEAGKLELDVHTFRMDELLDQMKTLFGSTADDKGLEIIFNIPPDVPRALKGDSLRLGQIFTNLLGNAVKFTEKGHVELAVKKAEGGRQKAEGRGQRSEGGSQESGAAGRESEPGTVRLLFEIKDTGIGMDDDQIQRLFQPFSQADTSTTRKYGGTGLGLVISHKLVQRMGGQLRVESTPGQGSSCWSQRPGSPYRLHLSAHLKAMPL